MDNSILLSKLEKRKLSITLEHLLENTKAESGGFRDLNFLLYLLSNHLLVRSEVFLKKTNIGVGEEYYIQKYKKLRYESDRHFLCRAAIQDDLNKLGIETLSSESLGDLNILRSSENYDIVTYDHSAAIDVGFTSARNFFKCLTDINVKNYLVTSLFDDYIDDIVFSVFSRSSDSDFIDAVKEYQEGFKDYIPQTSDIVFDVKYGDKI